MKLLVQFFYESEYDPQYPSLDRHDLNEAGKPKLTVLRRHGYHYNFPHTCCKPHCLDSAYKVCHHHDCYSSKCNASCVDFVCTECCPDWVPPTKGADASQLLLSAKMYEIGDKYDVVGFKQLALANFSLACEKYWESQEFASAAHYAFSTTPESDEGLRDIVTKTIADHMKIIKSPD